MIGTVYGTIAAIARSPIILEMANSGFLINK
jgi:hypothetical protein